MTLCILGINGFQAYWLYATWQLTATQFSRTAREALFAVLQEQQLTNARLLFANQGRRSGEVPGGRAESKAGTNRIIFRQFEHDDVTTLGADCASTSRQLLINFDLPFRGADSSQVTSTGRRVVVTTTARNRGRADADTLAHRISGMLLHDWATGRTASLPRLAAAYRAELRARGAAEVPFRLDTFTLAPPPGQVRVRVLNPPLRAGYALQTAPAPLNPMHDLYVQASFRSPTSYILRRMAGLLAGSVALLALTTGCFTLMLSTILRQKKLSEIKSDFINNMTHELKTPLATVSAAVEALRDFGALHDPEKTRAYLTISQQELRRLSDLVEKVLQMATEEREPLRLQPESVRPAELVDELVKRHQLCATKPATFTVDIPPTDEVRADPVHFANVVNNLLDNALKYSGEQVAVRVRGRRDGDGWRLTVADDGLGIAAGYQDSIFDRFFRVPTGNLHAVKGFGLGLYYVRQVITSHGGRISVRSAPGQGSEFAIWLPGRL